MADLNTTTNAASSIESAIPPEFKNIGVIAAFWLGAKLQSRWLRWGMFGFMLYQMYQQKKAATVAGGESDWRLDIDHNMAADMLFPSMDEDKKHIAKKVMGHAFGYIQRRYL